MEIVYVAQVLFLFRGYDMPTPLVLGKPHIYHTYEACKADVDKIQPYVDKVPKGDLHGGNLYYICVPVGAY